ncbi:hypothetical protein ABK040_011624 [Willaertia magna]
MKRNENPLFSHEKQEPQQKKLTATTQLHQLHYLTITNLNDDELQIVLSFLNISGVLFLSLTCKEIYQQIYEIIKQRHPILYSSLSSPSIPLKTDKNNYKPLSFEKKKIKVYNQEPKYKEWSITRALKEQNILYFQPHVYENIMNQLNCNIDLLNISNQFFLRDGSREQLTILEDLKTILKIERKQINKTELVDFIEIEKQIIKEPFFEDNNVNYYNFKMFKDINISLSIGSTLKKLKLKYIVYPPFKLYELFNYCFNLEYLYLNVVDDYSKPRKIVDLDVNVIKVPILKKLKELIIKNCYLCGKECQFVVNMIKLSPNIENFKYIYNAYPNDEFLEFLSNDCKHLKQLTIHSDDHDTPYPHEFTDNGILNLLKNEPSLTYLKLLYGNNFSGEFFTKIGQFAYNLETLIIDRSGEGGMNCDLYEDLYVGGGKLSKLKHFTLSGEFNFLSEKFFNTLRECAPNLIEFNFEMSNFEEEPEISDYKKLKDLMLNYITNFNSFNFDGFNLPIDEFLNCENLQTLIDIDEKINLNILQKCKWKKLKKLNIDCNNYEFITNNDNNTVKEWLYTLLSSCPQLEIFKLEIRDYNKNKTSEEIIFDNSFNETIIEILKEEKNWPNLTYFNSATFDNETEKLLCEIRPLLFTHASISRKTSSKKTKEEFYCEWWYGDYLLKQGNCQLIVSED